MLQVRNRAAGGPQTRRYVDADAAVLRELLNADSETVRLAAAARSAVDHTVRSSARADTRRPGRQNSARFREDEKGQNPIADRRVRRRSRRNPFITRLNLILALFPELIVAFVSQVPPQHSTPKWPMQFLP